MLHPDVLARLPAAAQEKLISLDILSDEALAHSESAREALHALGRKYGPVTAESPSAVRLAAAEADADHRRAELHALVGNIIRWVKSLKPDIPLEEVGPANPPILKGESVEDCIVAIRKKIGELTVERGQVANMPEPPDTVKAAIRRQLAVMAAEAAPKLKLEKGRSEVTISDSRADFGLSPGFVLGLLSWLDPAAMNIRIDAMVDQALAGKETMSLMDTKDELAEIDSELERLQREEENWVSLAFENGVDVLRRARADPQAVLGIRAVLPAAPAPFKRVRPTFPETDPIGSVSQAAE